MTKAVFDQTPDVGRFSYRQGIRLNAQKQQGKTTSTILYIKSN